jgi:hypothetical protein
MQGAKGGQEQELPIIHGQVALVSSPGTTTDITQNEMAYEVIRLRAEVDAQHQIRQVEATSQHQIREAQRKSREVEATVQQQIREAQQQIRQMEAAAQQQQIRQMEAAAQQEQIRQIEAAAQQQEIRQMEAAAHDQASELARLRMEAAAQEKHREQAEEIARLHADMAAQQQIRDTETKAQQQIHEAESKAQQQVEQVDEMTTLLTKSNESLTSLSHVLVDRFPRSLRQPKERDFPRITQSQSGPSRHSRVRTAKSKPSKTKSQQAHNKQQARDAAYQLSPPRQPAGGVGL